ncbi:OmpP1/FadL family transporter [Thiobacillus sp.]|uniref:OmpP1/FadL family transporter n=1 Tax=Thiobacillus sp. TaxID=924 RepID=UPI0025D777B8|nr:outer membrane protein transport protein [Thiobacillus sp.]MBT9540695.1 outer membrane protein transport protein [Thiobacillus sp.]
MKIRFNRLALGLALAGCGSLAHAAGFALIEQNASGLGNAYAGQAASAQDASTIYFNPAGMTLLPDSQLVLAGSLISPHAEFAGTVSPAIGGGDGGDAGDLAFVPNAYFAYRLSPDVRLGVGLYAPFGLKTEYDSSWMGRTQAIKSELKTINLNPAIAWQASETLSLGAGVSIQYAEATLTNSSPAGLVTVEGDNYGWGFNLGALWQMSEATRIGFAYHSEVDQTLEGDATFSGMPALNGPVSASLSLPDSASLSIFHKLGARWDVLADVTWTGWSNFYELRIVRESGAVLGTPTIENWDDSYRYSVGANYHFDDKLTLRGGVAYDETPVSDAYRTARIPDESRTWLAFGAQYRLSDTSILDVGYAHLFIDDARINKVENGATLSGTYEGSVDILSAQLTLNF